MRLLNRLRGTHSWFPLSVLMAESNDVQWENAEKIYGLAQDIGIGVLLIGMIL